MTWLGVIVYKNAKLYQRTVLNWKDDEDNTMLHIAVSKNQTQASSLSINVYKVLYYQKGKHLLGSSLSTLRIDQVDVFLFDNIILSRR